MPGLYRKKTPANLAGVFALFFILYPLQPTPIQKVAVGEGVRVGVFVGTFGVGVLVFVRVGDGTVGVKVAVFVRVGVGTVGVMVAVFVRVGDGTVAVRVGVLEGVRVMVGVRVIVGVRVMVGVRVIVGVRVMVGVRVGVRVKVGVRVGPGVLVGVFVATTVVMFFVQVPQPPRSNVNVTPQAPVKFLLLKSANQSADTGLNPPLRAIEGEALLVTVGDQLFAVA